MNWIKRLFRAKTKKEVNPLEKIFKPGQPVYIEHMKLKRSSPSLVKETDKK